MRVPCLLLVLLSCATPPLLSQDKDKAPPSSAAANVHACELFQLFRQMTPRNFCLSPHSSHQMAALLTSASGGETQAELAKLAHVDIDVAAGLAGTAALQATLADAARRGTLTLESTFSLWSASADSYQPAFVDLARSRFGVSLQSLPAGDATACATAVNRRVREKTHGRIAQIVGTGAFPYPGKNVVAVNTFYLRGLWSESFDRKLTQQRPFHTPQGAVMRPTMRMPQGRFWYLEAETWQCLGLPTAGGRGQPADPAAAR